MKIINGKDYYDSARAYGIDPNITFVRNSKDDIVYESLPAIFFPREGLGDYIEDRFETVNIYFCGKFYCGVRFKNKVYWDYESLIESIRISILNDNGTSWFNRCVKENYETIVKNKKIYVNYFANNGKDMTDKMVDLGITIAILRDKGTDHTVLSNGRRTVWQRIFDWELDSDTLKEFNFYTIKDPFTAFQEISMWVGGVLADNGNKMVKIVDEKIRIEKRGFDSKTSFRREPTKSR